MAKIESSISDAIQIEWEEHTHPEHVVVRSDGFSYTIYPSQRTMTNGDLEAMKKLAAPNAETNGSTFRIATVYDETLAAQYGFKNRSYFVRALSVGPTSNPERLAVGNYYELSSVGWAAEIDTQEPSDPDFRAVWLDACDVMEDKPEPGRIFIRGFVELTNARYDPESEFFFVENELSDYSASAQLIDRHWARYGAVKLTMFEKTCLPISGLQTKTAGDFAAIAILAVKLPVQLNEQLDTYRLHTKQAVRLECVDEMCQDIAAYLRDRRLHDNVVQEAIARREDSSIYRYANSI